MGMVCELVGRLGRLWTNVGRMACFIASVCLKVTTSDPPPPAAWLVARLGDHTLFTLHKALLLRPPTRSPSTAAARADPEDIALDGPGQ